ncbi:MAG: hypothetical protein KC731_13690 [Myxococcales bacterium]|nr:hypothetical protein [Myxococcales bacterium]
MLRWSSASFAALLITTTGSLASAQTTPSAVPPPREPRVVYHWDPDLPPPAGYEMVDEVNAALIGSGAGMLGAGWLTSVLVAVVATQVDDISSERASAWAPLYVPVAGPFVAIGTLDASAAGLGFLLADGILQVGGALGIILGITDTDTKLVRVGSVTIAPLVASDTRGLAIQGSF